VARTVRPYGSRGKYYWLWLLRSNNIYSLYITITATRSRTQPPRTHLELVGWASSIAVPDLVFLKMKWRHNPTVDENHFELKRQDCKTTIEIGKRVRDVVGHSPAMYSHAQQAVALLSCLYTHCGFNVPLCIDQEDGKRILDHLSDDGQRGNYFHGHAPQCRSRSRWIASLGRICEGLALIEQGGEGWMFELLRDINQSKTWMAACKCMYRFGYVGEYIGSQTLLHLFLGVYKGRSGLFRYHNSVIASMKRRTPFGNGPSKALRIMGASSAKETTNHDETAM
jgi:hypothetical protein